MPGAFLFFIDVVGIEKFFSDGVPLAIFVELAIEARQVTVVAGGAGLFYFDNERVFVAVGVNCLYFLRVPGRFAFHPVFLAASRPEVRLTRFNRVTQRGCVHVGDH